MSERHKLAGVCIVGPSAAGKSTVLKALKLSSEDRFGFPIRYVTRPARQDDDPSENCSLTESQFEQAWQADRLSLRWEKLIPGAPTVHYGFQRTRHRRVILGGNSDLLLGGTSIRPADGLQLIKFVLIRCELSTRVERLRKRNPELSTDSAEWRKRISDESDTLAPLCELTVDTTSGIVQGDLDRIRDLAQE